MQESSQQFLVLKCSTLHMGHCGREKSEKGHYHYLKSGTRLHTGMLFHSVPQQCRLSTVADRVNR